MREALQVMVSTSIRKQDIQITGVWDPMQLQQVPVLQYQAETFRLLNAFAIGRSQDVGFVWWNLTNNLGRTCLLLKGTKSYSIWEKMPAEPAAESALVHPKPSEVALNSCVRAALLLLQATHQEVDYLFGAKYAERFEQAIAQILQQSAFPPMASADRIQQLLTIDTLIATHLVCWQDQHLETLLHQLYQLALRFFGNENFTVRVVGALEELSSRERTEFWHWLKQHPSISELWKFAQTPSPNP